MTTNPHRDLALAIRALIQREITFGAFDLRLAHVWNVDPRNRIRVLSWGDFGREADRLGINGNAPMTWDTFRKIRSSEVSVQFLVPWTRLTDLD
jgi:hypothetical protein